MATKEVELYEEVPQAVVVGSKGRISKSLEFLAKTYEARSEKTKETRWVYSPLHKPELSNVIGRRMDGWKPITGKDLPEAMELLGIGEDDLVRHGDVVLMWIDPKKRAELRKEIDEKTREQASSIKREHYDKTPEISAGGAKMSDEHRVRPKGDAVIEEKEFEFDYTQREEGEE